MNRWDSSGVRRLHRPLWAGCTVLGRSSATPRMAELAVLVQNSAFTAGIKMATSGITMAKVVGEQYCFPWVPNHSMRASTRMEIGLRRADKTGVQDLRWPPLKGEKIAFKTDFGVQIGILCEIRQGLVWVDYILEDGRIIPESKLAMCPKETPWRHPNSVSEAERRQWADRIRQKLDDGLNLQKDPVAWEEFCHYVMFALLQVRAERMKLLNPQLDLLN